MNSGRGDSNINVVDFENSQKPGATFDLVDLKDLRKLNLEISPFNKHRIAFYVIIYATRGRGIHTIDFTDYEVAAGTVLTVGKGQVHSFDAQSNISGKMLLFTDAFLLSYLTETEIFKCRQLFNPIIDKPSTSLNAQQSKVIASTIRDIQQEYESKADDLSPGIIRCHLQILVSKLFRYKSANKPTTFNKKNLREFWEFQNLLESSVFQNRQVSHYAKLLGVSSKTLTKNCKSVVERTPKQIIDEVCIQKIKRLLINTEKTVDSIALDAGFKETSNFFKYFKRQTTMTPLQFREHHSVFYSIKS